MTEIGFAVAVILAALAWSRWGSRRAVTIAAVLVMVALWADGALDEPLSHVGLNREPCIVNAFGARFCGDDARQYCSRVRDLVDETPTVCADLRS